MRNAEKGINSISYFTPHSALRTLHSKGMFTRFFIFVVFVFVFAAFNVSAQQPLRTNSTDASKQNSYDRQEEPLPENALEMRIKWRQRAEEKEFKEMLDRSANVTRLCDELQKSFTQSNTLTSADAAKLNELEKLVKKIRRSLGGDDDNDSIVETKPVTLAEAISKLTEIGAALNEELKSTSRFETSASAIENTNEMLELIAFIRTISQIK